jgi:uncharacterized membrane protein YjfL (UPF0719 family)
MSTQLSVVLMNFCYAIIGGLLTIALMFVGFKIIDKLTKLDTSAELARGNTAVGAMVQGMFIGVGIAVGLVIGLGLN